MKPSLSALSLSALLALEACKRQTQAPAAAPPTGPARVVVVVVLDQVGQWVLERYLPRLDADGALRGAVERGSFHTVQYPYAGTYTAPGHAAIFTGAAPRHSHIAQNRRWNAPRRNTLSVVDDGAHSVFGVSAAHAANASPSILRAESVADVLARETQGRGRAVCVSMKDRGSVVPCGQRPTMAVWYDENARAFTTSNYYAPSLPPWLATFNQTNPASARLTIWNPINAASLSSHGVDDAAGEGDWKGFGRVFPHDVRRSSDPYGAFVATPMSSEWLLDLAESAAETYALGADDTPDLLSVSISGTDYVGHVFGPESWEAEDNLIRVDRALARFLRRLRARTTVALVVTADHGVALLPESSRRQGVDAQRLDWDDLPRRADAALDVAIGAGDWAESFVQPFLMLTAAARAEGVRERAVTAAIAAMRATPGVYGAYDVRARETLAQSADPIERAVAASIPDDAPGDVFVVPGRGSLIDERMPSGSGTSHGSPWEYDTRVPAIVEGYGVSHLDARATVLAQSRVAATIAALLRVSAPRYAEGGALPGVARPTPRSSTSGASARTACSSGCAPRGSARSAARSEANCPRSRP